MQIVLLVNGAQQKDAMKAVEADAVGMNERMRQA